MKKIALTGLIAVAVALPQLASGDIVLAGWHSFTLSGNSTLPVDPNAKPVDSFANEGVAGIISAPGTLIAHKAAISSGGSTDGHYGPDITSDGAATNQTPFDPNARGSNGTYLSETHPANGRSSSSYGGAWVPGDTSATRDPFLGTAAASQPGTTMDGSISSTKQTEVFISNGSDTSYTLSSFVFDAFIGHSTPGSIAAISSIVVSFTGATTDDFSVQLPITRSYSGFNTILNPSQGSDTLKLFDATVSNIVDYGTGTNYLDYVVDLRGFNLEPGALIGFGFNTIGNDGEVRLDNLALLAVPEPGSIMALVGLISSGCFFRRRKQK